MIRLVLFVALLVPLLFISAKAIAQTKSGWVAALDANANANANSFNGQLPPVNEPQPGWSPKFDFIIGRNRHGAALQRSNRARYGARRNSDQH